MSSGLAGRRGDLVYAEAIGWSRTGDLEDITERQVTIPVVHRLYRVTADAHPDQYAEITGPADPQVAALKAQRVLDRLCWTDFDD